jgi:preprotein translocase subunit SecF
MNILSASLPSIFIAFLGFYAFSVGNISLNNLILLFIGLTVGTAASIFRSKKILIEKSKKSQDSKE